MKENIILVGPPGSGKSTVGRILSEKTGMPFLDLDELISDTEGMSIAEIFEFRGEPHFRQVERSLVSCVSEVRRVIVATGGGAWMDEANQKKLRKNGIVIALMGEPSELWARLEESPIERPLLKEGFGALQSLYESREHLYRLADNVLDTNGKSPLKVAEEIASLLGLGSEKLHLTPKVLKVSVGESPYSIHMGTGLIKAFGEILARELGQGARRPRLFVVTDPLVKALAGREFTDGLTRAGFSFEFFVVPQGEENKSLAWAEKALMALSTKGYDRGDIVVALGGGVIGDLAGFVAAVYMRGIKVVQIPTTLLAQVDSSVGGKTAVDLPTGKNLVGAFHQPSLVVSDIGILSHLSFQNLRQGLGECIKYGLISDRQLFELIEENGYSIMTDLSLLQEIVMKCCDIKAGIVEQDEKDLGLRMILNAGHTIGHALEVAAGYGRLSHGEAVGLGLLAECHLASDRNLLPASVLHRLEGVLNDLHFPMMVEADFAVVEKALRLDKKSQRGSITLPLVVEIGRTELFGGVSVEDLVPYARRFVACPKE